jgi:uncharacterized protein
MVALTPLTERVPRPDSNEENGLGRKLWSAAEPDSIEALQVVYKIAERCNINCTYCYYFNMGDETPLARPALAKLEVTRQLAEWMAQGCEELRIPRAKLSFHGGEPTMVGVRAFDAACQTLREIIEPVAALSLSIQTNGTLLDERWIEKFIEHRVGVGVSIDGPRTANDRYRLDRRGRSTFQNTEDAIRRLVDAYAAGGPLPGTISVIHPGNDYRRVYRYLRDLGVLEINFLLPDRNADEVEFVRSGAAAEYGRCLSDIFSEWLEEDNSDVRIKFIDEMMAHFRPHTAPGQVFRRMKKTNQVVIARSDGTVAVDDSYIPALDWYSAAPVYSTAECTLRQFLADPIFNEIEHIGSALPTGCQDCRWRRICRGGDLENRFSTQNGFNNPSVYCGAYKLMYQNTCDKLAENGYPPELLQEKFEFA